MRKVIVWLPLWLAGLVITLSLCGAGVYFLDQVVRGGGFWNGFWVVVFFSLSVSIADYFGRYFRDIA